MKEQIHKLIEHHKLAKQECYELLKELNSIDTDKLSENEKESLKMTIISHQIEYSWRGTFISQLEDIID